jgi:hypothetical protein
LTIESTSITLGSPIKAASAELCADLVGELSSMMELNGGLEADEDELEPIPGLTTEGSAAALRVLSAL